MGSNDGGFSFDLVKRNTLLERKGMAPPSAWKTGTTIAGVVFKVGGADRYGAAAAAERRPAGRLSERAATRLRRGHQARPTWRARCGDSPSHHTPSRARPPSPTQDGVVLGADTRSTSGSTVADKNCEKIHYIAPNIYCCGAGTAADTMNVTAMISSALDLHRYATGRQSRVVTSMTMLKSHLFRCALRGMRARARAHEGALRGCRAAVGPLAAASSWAAAVLQVLACAAARLGVCL